MHYTYKTDDGTAYDVSLLSEQGQGLFSLIQHSVTKIKELNKQIQVMQAGATHIKALFEAELTDDAIVEDTDEEPETN
ncbi:hypothetical protein N9917_01910 [Deltaproteobacteria bacterium]|nr:hypothetical protein [Deltaproteobacteria bacterium]